jgi:two-component system, chemotaxis family, CheB/CheR fusion protein
MIIAGIGASAGGLDSLKKVLPSLPRNAGIAYVIVQHLSPKHRIQIFATDVDEDSVRIAWKNEYPLATIMDTDGRRFGEHFSQFDSTVAVNKRIRDMVVLARQDVIKDTPFMHLDLISCRNLMIYMNAELQEQLLSLFHYALNPGGLLLLGKSESINLQADLFEVLDRRWKIYRRKEVSKRSVPSLLMKKYADKWAQPKTDPMVPETQHGNWREGVFFDALLDTLGCGAALTDDHANIIYLRGDLSPYLRLQEGAVPHPEIRNGPRGELR